MHSILRNFAVGAAIALCAPFASATVLTFDDIVGAGGYASVPDNFGGLDWSNAGLSVFTGEQAPFTPAPPSPAQYRRLRIQSGARLVYPIKQGKP